MKLEQPDYIEFDISFTDRQVPYTHKTQYHIGFPSCIKIEVRNRNEKLGYNYELINAERSLVDISWEELSKAIDESDGRDLKIRGKDFKLTSLIDLREFYEL